MLLLIFFLFIFSSATALIDTHNKATNRDTSFNIRSATIKVLKDFPFAEPVAEMNSDHVIAINNIVYTAYGNRNLHLDIFEPVDKENGPYPGVLLIHGGGWRSGDKSMERPMAQRLAALGFVTAVVEYRLSPEALYPAAIHDIKAAIVWMRANASHYNIDPDKIAVYGTSAGGHLASFVGVTSNIKKFERKKSDLYFSSNVQAVINIDGILDFTHPAESNKDSDPLNPSVGKAWLGYSFKENPGIWMEVSPFNYVDENTPPFLFVNSSIDRFHAGRDYMIGKMNHYNIYSEVHTIPDTPHTFWLFHPWFEQTLSYVANFLDYVFKRK